MRVIRLLKSHLLFYLFLLVCQLAFAQSHTVTGIITDTAGSPLTGASVQIKGVATATSSKVDGVFSLTTRLGSGTLVVSYVGYVAREVPFSGDANLIIKLFPQDTKDDEVVVIGYGTARKKDVTGSISTVSAKDFNQGPTGNAMQQVAGKVPGLVITQPSGDPNQTVQIRLRGQTSLTGNQVPLIVVDGVQLPDPNIISTINPANILSYDVLKDASATAIYGARGANGVIIIQTKKGKSGRTQVDYNGLIGFQKNAKKFDLLNGPQFTAAGGTTQNYIAGQPTITNGNTDWIDAITQTGIATSHNIGISGGADRFNFRGSVNYYNEKGIAINSGKQLFGIDFNAQQKSLSDKLVINLGVNINRTNRKHIPQNVFYEAWQMPPVGSVYDSTGNFYGYRNYLNIYNPVTPMKLQLNNETDQTSLWSGSMDYELLKGIKIGGAASLFYYTQQNNFYSPVMPGYPPPANGSQSSANNNSTRGELHINFNRSYGMHNIDATGVYEYNYFVQNRFNANGSFYIYDPTENNNLGAGNPATNQIGSGKSAYKLIGFLGRVRYNYDSKYYLTASLRRDGSSKFGVNNQWGYFPSLSVAWRIGRESFIKDISWINELKLNVGWGSTGNSDGLVPYQTLLLLGTGSNFYNPSNSIFPYQPSYVVTQNANTDLKWESRVGWNYSLDFALFKNRLSGSINMFNDETRNLLYKYNVPTPPFFVNNIWANVGNMANKGLEIQLNGDVIRNNNFSWNLGGQISFVKTTVKSLSGTYNGYKIATDNISINSSTTGRGSGVPITYLKVGYSPVVFWLPHYVGLDENGQELFDDGKGGKVLSAAVNTDAFRYTDPAPKFSYGVTNTFSHKQWSLNFFLRGLSGVKIYDEKRLVLDNVSGLAGGNVTKSGLASGDKSTDLRPSDKWLENASFLRLDNASLGYTFKKFSEHIDNLRIYVAGNNLFVITKYRGLDPEVQTTASANNAYIDGLTSASSYLKYRSFSIGVNLLFK